MKRSEIRKLIDGLDLPSGDDYNFVSKEIFPDGASWRVEVSGMETPKILRATVDEARKQGLPFHRAISLVRGSSLYTPVELREFAEVAASEAIEVIVTPGPRPTWYTGRQIATPEGVISGFGMRGIESVTHYFEEIFRCLDIGFRGFLVWDIGILAMFQHLRTQGAVPEDVTLKWSVFGGCGNAFSAKIIEDFGANTINPLADLDIGMLASIRQAIVTTPMDIHIQLWQSMGGYNRIHETPDIVRVASPCYFKMESGPGFAMYAQWNSEDGLAEMGRNKIKSVKVIADLIRDNCPEFALSEHGVDDLRIPKPRG